MPKPVWEKILSQCIDPARSRFYLDQLLATSAGFTLRRASEEQIRVLVALFTGSQALSEQLVTHPEWILQVLNPELLKNPRQIQGLRRDVSNWLAPALGSRDRQGGLRSLRNFKQREMVRIAARDLSRFASTMETTQELSDVADICIESVYQLLWHQFTLRYGHPWHRDSQGNWQPTGFCVLGLGKLGGQELNYSSDIDLMLVYQEEGFLFPVKPRKSDPGKGMSNHQFFIRFAKELLTEIARSTDEGMLYRVDVRLRPEGESGPLARSLASYENYYAQWGQIWERMMLIKARVVAGAQELGAEFLETIQSFRYPRNLSRRILDEIANMKDRIESEILQAGELDRNVKLGRGGIREVEFIAQARQILHAGKNPFLQNTQTLPALQYLVRYGLLAPEAGQDLNHAYCFLRDVEHRLQMENNLQTHTIPTDRKSRERLASLMGFTQIKDFESHLGEHTDRVRSLFDEVLKSDARTPSIHQFSRDFELHEKAWRALLAKHGFQDVSHAVHLMDRFVNGPGYVHISERTAELALELVPVLLSYCSEESPPATPAPAIHYSKRLSDPDRVLARLDSFIQAYGSRAMLYEAWIHNLSQFELLLLLFDRSEYLAEMAIRTPDLLEELQLSGRLRRQKCTAEILKDLRYGRDDPDQALWMRRYNQAEQMRIGLRDILGLAEPDNSYIELTALADACLEYALEVIMRRHKLRSPPFTIIALGKLGGCELNYGSDLDIVFVTDSPHAQLAGSAKYAVEILEMLSKPTELGVVFSTDTRLRPDGEHGPLVNTMNAYDIYFRERAQLWEILAYTRARPVAGQKRLGERFMALVRGWTDFSRKKPIAASYQQDWKQQIAKMRGRIENERTTSGEEHLAIKTGAGGLMDAEFVAQINSLENGWHEPNTVKALARIKDEMPSLSAPLNALITSYQMLRQIESILRRWSYAGESVLPAQSSPLHRVAIRCGFDSAEAFLTKVSQIRDAMREAFRILVATEGKM